MAWIGDNVRYKKDLSDREKEVLKCLMSGKTNRYIGEALGITTKTVKFHIN